MRMISKIMQPVRVHWVIPYARWSLPGSQLSGKGGNLVAMGARQWPSDFKYRGLTIGIFLEDVILRFVVLLRNCQNASVKIL